MTECAITLLCQSANNGSLAKIIPSPGYRDVWQTHYVRYQIMWHLQKYFWDEDNWILWGELFMSQIIIPVFRRPGFPHSADVTFSTTNTDPYSTRWFFDGCENINASAAPSSIFLLIHPQYVLSTIINVPFVLLKKEIIFPLLPNNIYFHHHYFFPLLHPQYFLDSTINISLAPHQYSFWPFFHPLNFWDSTINISLAPPSTSNAITFQFPFHWVQLSPDWWTVIVCFRGRPVNISA